MGLGSECSSRRKGLGKPMANRQLNGKLVTIFGGGGFIGRYVAQLLMDEGARIRIAERQPRDAYAIRPLGKLGQTQFVPADVTKPDTVAAACAGADIVINLAGVIAGDFDGVNARGAKYIAEAAKTHGVAHLVHVSALGADATSEAAYARTKGEGEAAVRAAFPQAVILRPSIVFGREDKFINKFAGYFSGLNLMPIVMGQTKLQPVYVEDVAQAVRAAILNASTANGETFELGGPEISTMKGLLFWIGRATGQTVYPVDIPDFLSGLGARLIGWLPGAPVTYEQWLMLQKDVVVSDGAKTLADLGVAATPIAAVAEPWLVQYRTNGRFGKKARA